MSRPEETRELVRTVRAMFARADRVLVSLTMQGETGCEWSAYRDGRRVARGWHAFEVTS